ncbi:ROK family transcriptional regulator [Salsuginibacillus kocurii]|uniref:ROK family transcriptional regulator n=1 Tax=Salsuginibacillus kocurii TaxID=427078 RepID=UPI00039FF8F6|nr:ROK family transcriptional regulator [Salsuginibacillus kocurii]
MKTGDQNLVKKLNKSIVLDILQKQSPISRAQISKTTGLTKATVSSLVSELMNESFIYEIGSGESKGGRKPVMLYFNKNAGYSIGIDVGVDYILAILTDLQGNIIDQTEMTFTTSLRNEIIEKIKNTISYLSSRCPTSPYGIVGIGVGVPGITDINGTILFAPNLDWHNVALKEELEQTFNLPVVIENEANAGAHGEKVYGAGKNVSNLIYVSIGTGIGTGIILGNELYKGENGIAGEMGHISIDPNGKKCNCGNLGCWELYASESALVQQATSLSTFNENYDITLELLCAAAHEGNGEVLNLLNTIGDYIGLGITNIVNVFNPKQIIIGNRFSKLESWIANPVDRVIEQRLLPQHQQSLEVTFSHLGAYSCALGSAAFSLSNFLSHHKMSID